jgi:hypothetical protein
MLVELALAADAGRWAPSNSERTSGMSLWIHGKERKGGRSLYLLDVPFELAFLLVGIMIVLVILLLRRLGLVSYI